MVQIPAHVRSQAIPATLEAFGTFKPVLLRYPKTRKFLQAIVIAQTTHKALSGLREAFTPKGVERDSWTVTIKSEDALYDHALTLMARQSTQNWKAIKAELEYDYDYDDDSDTSHEKPKIETKPAESTNRNFTIKGHSIAAYVETFAPSRIGGPGQVRPSGQQMLAMGVSIGPSYRPSPEVVFDADSEAGQKAVIDALLDIAGENKDSGSRKRKPQLWRQRGYGGWDRAGDLPIRPVESVAVTDNQVQRVVDDILAFRELEPEYLRRGVPFHRGYLLFGPPGTGKTSAIKAIAHAVGSDLYAANLGTLNDAGLAELVQGVQRSRNPAILLLEDIDSFDAARQRDEDDEGDRTGATAGISTTGLLNALDGVETPHGLITILTTNHPEFLDDALIRPGRVDKKVEFGFPDDATVSRHFEFFFGRKPTTTLYANGRSGAELNEVFVMHMTDPDGAEAALSVRSIATAA